MKKFGLIFAALAVLFAFSSCSWEADNDDSYYTYTCKIAERIPWKLVDSVYSDRTDYSGSNILSYYLKTKDNENLKTKDNEKMFDARLLVLEDIFTHDDTKFFDSENTFENFDDLRNLLNDHYITERQSDQLKETCKTESPSFREMVILVDKTDTFDVIYFKMNKKSR